jgi:hypothetical protein
LKLFSEPEKQLADPTKGLQALMTSQINDDLLDLKVQAIFGQNDESEPRISAEEKERQDEL